ncbi:MAG: (2Fe-2S)-binding protein [Myxococcaceae bacterium]|nr:(2Fe-2S)-binding protein [Myxococcaceae bacterium]
MIVCICRVVSDRTIRAAIQEGASTVHQVAMACRAGTVCGGCRPQIAELIAESRGGVCSPVTAPEGADCPMVPTPLVSSAA